MRGKAFISHLLLIAQLLSVSGYAIESNCPWNLQLLMGKSAADRLEPSTQLALQDILKAVYDNPPEPGKPLNSKTSVADDLWLNEFSMWDIVREMAELGQQRLHREKVDRKRKLMRASFFGTLGLFGGAAILSFALDPNRFSLLQPELQYAEDKDDDDTETGLRVRREKVDLLTGKTAPEPAYGLLKSMLACDPHRDLAPNQERVRDLFTDYERSFKMMPEKIVERLVVGKSDNREYRNEKQREEMVFERFSKIYKLYKEYGVVLCTRWGHPSAGTVDDYGLETLQLILSELPAKLLKDQDMRIVLQNSSYRVPSKEMPFPVEMQLGEKGELEMFTGMQFNSRAQRALIGTTLVRRTYHKWSPEKKRAWEDALKGEKGRAVLGPYSQLASNINVHSIGVSTPPDFVFSFLVAVRIDDEDSRRLREQNPEAAKMIGEAKKEIGFDLYEQLLDE